MILELISSNLKRKNDTGYCKVHHIHNHSELCKVVKSSIFEGKILVLAEKYSILRGKSLKLTGKMDTVRQCNNLTKVTNVDKQNRFEFFDCGGGILNFTSQNLEFGEEIFKSEGENGHA